MPQGLQYINSWIDFKISTCYQVMETESEEKIHQWIMNWNDLADFEVIPVISSEEAKTKVFSS